MTLLNLFVFVLFKGVHTVCFKNRPTPKFDMNPVFSGYMQTDYRTEGLLPICWYPVGSLVWVLNNFQILLGHEVLLF